MVLSIKNLYNLFIKINEKFRNAGTIKFVANKIDKSVLNPIRLFIKLDMFIAD